MGETRGQDGGLLVWKLTCSQQRCSVLLYHVGFSVFFHTPAPPPPISPRTVRMFPTVSFLDSSFPGWGEAPCRSSTLGLRWVLSLLPPV